MPDVAISNPYVRSQYNLMGDWSLPDVEKCLDNPQKIFEAWTHWFALLFRTLFKEYNVQQAELEANIRSLAQEMTGHIGKYKWYAHLPDVPESIQEIARTVQIITEPVSTGVQVSVMFPPVEANSVGHMLKRVFATNPTLHTVGRLEFAPADASLYPHKADTAA